MAFLEKPIKRHLPVQLSIDVAPRKFVEKSQKVQNNPPSIWNQQHSSLEHILHEGFIAVKPCSHLQILTLGSKFGPSWQPIDVHTICQFWLRFELNGFHTHPACLSANHNSTVLKFNRPNFSVGMCEKGLTEMLKSGHSKWRTRLETFSWQFS